MVEEAENPEEGVRTMARKSDFMKWIDDQVDTFRGNFEIEPINRAFSCFWMGTLSDPSIRTPDPIFDSHTKILGDLPRIATRCRYPCH